METSLEALYACRNHWQWLWITGANDKLSYPLSNEWPYGCACCLYAGAFLDDYAGAFLDDNVKISWDVNRDYRDCKLCPLNNYAWNTDPLDEDAFCANSNDSVYMDWNNNPNSENAYRMVQACNRAIEDILCKS